MDKFKRLHEVKGVLQERIELILILMAEVPAKNAVACDLSPNVGPLLS